MAEVQITVADLYRIIGEKEIVIHRLSIEKAQLERQVASLTATIQAAQKAAVQAPSDGKE